MTLDSRATAVGDNLFLISSVHTLPANTLLTFWVHMKLSSIDHVARMALLSATANGRPVATVYELSTSSGYLLISNNYSYYYHYFIYLSSTILYYANHVTLSKRRHSSIELWRMRLISVSK